MDELTAPARSDGHGAGLNVAPPPLQGEGRRFDPVILHRFECPRSSAGTRISALFAPQTPGDTRCEEAPRNATIGHVLATLEGLRASVIFRDRRLSDHPAAKHPFRACRSGPRSIEPSWFSSRREFATFCLQIGISSAGVGEWMGETHTIRPLPAAPPAGPPPGEIAQRGRSPPSPAGPPPPRHGGWTASETGPRNDATRGASPGSVTTKDRCSVVEEYLLPQTASKAPGATSSRWRSR
jgi:hypothetical protein